MLELNETARRLAAAGKGILAADESTKTIAKRLQSVAVESTEENRRAYRELLFTPPGLGQYISGVILYDETLRQRAADGRPMPEVLSAAGIIPGIKVDKGAKPLAFFPGEKVTEGLDGLRERFQEYATMGARFSKWRAVLAIAPGLPSRFCLESNAQALARFAALSQEAGLVPIVEPEVTMEGDHSLERCEEATSAALAALFPVLAAHQVQFEGLLLKPNMIVPGKDSPDQASSEQVAAATLRCLKRFVPAAVLGIMFLSGGLSEVTATRHLNAMNRAGDAPWELSFSFGRALQAPVLQAWAGKQENVPLAQKALLHRARCNHEARSGRYTELTEGAAGTR